MNEKTLILAENEQKLRKTRHLLHIFILISLFLVLFNLFMALNVRHQIDNANNYWINQLETRGCIIIEPEFPILDYDITNITYEKKEGIYKWR